MYGSDDGPKAWTRFQEESKQIAVPMTRAQVRKQSYQSRLPEYKPEALKYGWGMFYADIDRIWEALGEFKGRVNWVIAIERGGVCPGAVLADRLGASLFSLKVKSYRGREKLSTIQIGTVSDHLIKASAVLVDDIVDGGRTFREVEKLLQEKGVNLLRKVALCKRRGVKGDFIFGREVGKGEWIDFPWWFVD